MRSNEAMKYDNILTYRTAKIPVIFLNSRHFHVHPMSVIEGRLAELILLQYQPNTYVDAMRTTTEFRPWRESAERPDAKETGESPSRNMGVEYVRLNPSRSHALSVGRGFVTQLCEAGSGLKTR